MIRLVVNVLALLSFFFGVTTGVHPHPETDEDHKHYHRSLKKEEYQMKYINSALCHNVTREECQGMEDDMVENARVLREMVHRTGFVRVLVLLVQFTDHADRELPPKENYVELFQGIGISDIIPTGSVRDYLWRNSYGKMKIEVEVADWTLTDNTEEYYSFGRSGITHDLRKAYYPALDRLEREGFDFSRFDQNGDGKIDLIVMLHSGFAAEIGGRDCYNSRGHEHRIWAHALSSQTDNWVSARTGIAANGYCVSTAVRGHCQSRPARIGVTTHEMLHVYGLPDLNDGARSGPTGRGVGEFDIMSAAHDLRGAQINPAHLSPWSKMKLEWIEPIEITHDGVYHLEPSELAPDIFIVRAGFEHPDLEYFLIENRQPIGYDALLWDGGILIWHIDDSQVAMMNRGYPGQEGWPSNGAHYQIALASPDELYDLETGRNSGDNGDYWTSSSRSLEPGLIESVATDAGTYPNTNSYIWGHVQQTGLTFSEFSTSSIVMSFRITGVGQAPSIAPSPFPTFPFTSSPTLKPTLAPTLPPTTPPTPQPTAWPTAMHSIRPTTTPKPTMWPTPDPSARPSVAPTGVPSTVVPTTTKRPSPVPSDSPTIYPTSAPMLRFPVSNFVLPYRRVNSSASCASTILSLLASAAAGITLLQ